MTTTSSLIAQVLLQVTNNWVISKNSFPPPTIDRQSADKQPTASQQFTNSLPKCLVRLLTDWRVNLVSSIRCNYRVCHR